MSVLVHFSFHPNFPNKFSTLAVFLILQSTLSGRAITTEKASPVVTDEVIESGAQVCMLSLLNLSSTQHCCSAVFLKCFSHCSCF